MTIKDVIGTWDLVSLYAESAKGEIWQIYGENPLGMLTYTNKDSRVKNYWPLPLFA